MFFSIGIFVATLKPLVTNAAPINALTNDAMSGVNITNVTSTNGVKTNVHEKYYQQALYYYFQGNYAGALAILNQSQSRLKSTTPIAQLFEAGLQVKIGLQEQARKNLQQLITKKNNTDTSLNTMETPENQSTNQAYIINSQQLLVIALLSLAEQYIEQGEMIQAQQSLAKIQQISPRHYQQYQVLNQLAYWPKQPILLQPSALIQVNDPSSADDNKKLSTQSYSTDLSVFLVESPYVKLNNALRYIEEENFEPAIILLNQLKSREWQSPEKSFFQLLFSNDTPSRSNESEKASHKVQEDIQNQAIIDYSRLLLAHLYSQQALYNKVYDELKTFPQQSNYTESALFLYAFSAQKIKQQTISLTLLNLLHQQYPYSTLGWQAGLLIAKQVTEQQGLAQGWQSYQNVESFYLNTIEQLNLFEHTFEQSFEQSLANNTNLMALSTTKPSENHENNNNNKMPIEDNFLNVTATYQPESIWLKQAMLELSLNNLFQQLSQVTALLKHCQLLQDKSDEIFDIVALNTKRKARIVSEQQASQKYNTYETLTKQSEQLAIKLRQALNDPHEKGIAFANESEQVWLARLKQSKENLAFISHFSFPDNHNHEKEQLTNLSYQQRLNRLEGVLAWRLSQTFPERAWQHKQQLGEIENNLKQLKKIQTNVSGLMAESAPEQRDSSLKPYIKRQQIAESNIKPLVKNLTQLKAKIAFKIREKVIRFSHDRKTLLAEHLLTTRKAMAAVLEQMSVNDNKIEKQLNPGKEGQQGVSKEVILEKAINKEDVVQNQSVKIQSTNQSQLHVRENKPLTIKEQAINDQRAKQQAIKALRKALEKKEPSSSKLNSEEKSTTKQKIKGVV